uniref:Uncharacterized protein n=2 Tax=Oryza sativa subsp. japonica TaxID=39947 RepID=Q2R9P6_ORYSJ|nr:hypothetical protein LOC_Os11g08030 [Oryza sativa Japonica Group]ABA91807.1 hypothetical protein LOC_Os11g08029 [Oryza sativa Japonica Group]
MALLLQRRHGADAGGDRHHHLAAEWPKVTWHNLDFLEIPPDEIV